MDTRKHLLWLAILLLIALTACRTGTPVPTLDPQQGFQQFPNQELPEGAFGESTSPNATSPPPQVDVLPRSQAVLQSPIDHWSEWQVVSVDETANPTTAVFIDLETRTREVTGNCTDTTRTIAAPEPGDRYRAWLNETEPGVVEFLPKSTGTQNFLITQEVAAVQPTQPVVVVPTLTATVWTPTANLTPVPQVTIYPAAPELARTRSPNWRFLILGMLLILVLAGVWYFRRRNS